MLVALLLIVVGLVTPSVAQAADNGTMTVSVTPVNSVTGAPQSEAGYGLNQNTVAYKVSVTCSVADCVNAKVVLSPSQPDPYGMAAQLPAGSAGQTLLMYSTWAKPAGAGTPTGNDKTAGWTFPLGTLTAGTSLSFPVTYRFSTDGPDQTIKPGQFYPDGFQIQMSATASSDTITAPVSSSAAPVSWRQQVPTPQVQISAASIVQPDVNVPVTGAMTTGALVWSGATGTGQSKWAAAAGYTVVMELPAQAVINGPIPDFGTYDPVAHTITWVRGNAAAPFLNAAGGWGLVPAGGWYTWGPYAPRTVPVKFPGTSFSPTGCDFEQQVPLKITTKVNYLDAARTTKTATNSRNITVACVSPFPGSSFSKVNSNSNGGITDTSTVLVPQPGSSAVGQYQWMTYAFNTSNRPSVATVVDDTLDQPDAPVWQITASIPSTFNWTLDNGATGTTVNTSQITAPAGRRYAKVTVVSGTIAAGRVKPTDNGSTSFIVTYKYAVTSSAPIGETRTNTASSTMSWPTMTGDPKFTPQTKTASTTFRFVGGRPSVTASMDTPTVVGGGQAVTGSKVSFGVKGSTNNVPTGSAFTPEYVFIAPPGWTIKPNSATMGAGAPSGVTFAYATRTIGGVQRDVVVASWPAGTAFANVASLPTMTVIAVPGPTVSGGSTSTAEARIGDSARLWTGADASWANAKQNTGNVDGTGDTSAWFSTQTAGVLVQATDRMDLKKEICLPDTSKPDGCDWIASPGQTVNVRLDTSAIKYRVTIANAGNTVLQNVVAYDTLPYAGDKGLIPATEGLSRGSEFDLTLASVSNVSSNVALTYSSSKNPTRPEVSPNGVTNDWGTAVAGRQSIRAQVAGGLAPGASVSFVYVAAVGANSGSDAQACNSVAGVSTQTAASEPLPVCAQLQTFPAVSVTKAADLTGLSDPVRVGDVITYSFVAKNDGDVQLDGVVIADPLPGLSAVSYVWPGAAGVLAPGEKVTASATYAVTQVDIDNGVVKNTATVKGIAPAGTPTVTGTSTPVDSELERLSGITLVKSASPGSVSKAGDVITYSLVATNSGNVTLDGVTVEDLVPGVNVQSTTWPGAVGVLAPGEKVTVVATYGVTQTDIDRGTVDNTAVASGDGPDGSTPSDDSSTSTPVSSAPSLSVVKSASPSDEASYVLGQVITYTFVVTNEGNKTISSPAVVEGAFDGDGGLVMDCSSLPASLAPDAQASCTATYTLTQADIDRGSTTNSATVSGKDPKGDSVTSAVSTVTIPGVAEPAVSFTKIASSATVQRAGDVVTYTFAAKNTGNVTLHDVSVVDPLPGLSAVSYVWPGAAGVLAPGEEVTATATYKATQSNIDAGTFTNTASVTAVDPHDTLVKETASATVTATAAPAVSVVKSADVSGLSDPVRAGDVITYSFVASNDGNVTLSGVVVSDPLPGLSAVSYVWPGAAGVLAPGEKVTASATYAVTQADVDNGVVKNTATATGQAPDLTKISSEESSVSSSLKGLAELTIDKASDVRDAKPGDRIAYTFTVTNTGTLTMSDVEILDELPHLSQITYTWPGEPGVLKPGELLLGSATYLVRSEDAIVGKVVNTATASGTVQTRPDRYETSMAKAEVRVTPLAEAGGGLAVTGGQVPLVIGAGALALLIGGVAATLVGRRKRTA